MALCTTPHGFISAVLLAIFLPRIKLKCWLTGLSSYQKKYAPPKQIRFKQEFKNVAGNGLCDGHLAQLQNKRFKLYNASSDIKNASEGFWSSPSNAYMIWD